MINVEWRLSTVHTIDGVTQLMMKCELYEETTAMCVHESDCRRAEETTDEVPSLRTCLRKRVGELGLRIHCANVEVSLRFNQASAEDAGRQERSPTRRITTVD